MLVLCALKFEADRRSFMIAINSIGTYLTVAERLSLCPRLGRLYPHGHAVLANAKDYDEIKLVAKQFVVRYYSTRCAIFRRYINCVPEKK